MKDSIHKWDTTELPGWKVKGDDGDVWIPGFFNDRMCDHMRVMYVRSAEFRYLLRSLTNRVALSQMDNTMTDKEAKNYAKEFNRLHTIAHNSVTFN